MTKSLTLPHYEIVRSNCFNKEKSDFELNCPAKRDEPAFLKDCFICPKYVGLLNALYSNETVDAFPTLICIKRIVTVLKTEKCKRKKKRKGVISNGTTIAED